MEPSLSIVLVEDDDDSREMLQLFLEGRGHRVFAVRDGAQGVTAILQRRPALALVDISLPLMSGLDVARVVRSDWCTASCPHHPGGSVCLVALTGFGRGDDRLAVMKAGFDEYILKPIRPGELDRLIGLALRLQLDTHGPA